MFILPGNDQNLYLVTFQGLGMGDDGDEEKKTNASMKRRSTSTLLIQRQQTCSVVRWLPICSGNISGPVEIHERTANLSSETLGSAEPARPLTSNSRMLTASLSGRATYSCAWQYLCPRFRQEPSLRTSFFQAQRQLRGCRRSLDQTERSLP